MYGNTKKNLVHRLQIFYLVFQRLDSQILKSSILEEVICYRIPMQTL